MNIAIKWNVQSSKFFELGTHNFVEKILIDFFYSAMAATQTTPTTAFSIIFFSHNTLAVAILALDSFTTPIKPLIEYNESNIRHTDQRDSHSITVVQHIKRPFSVYDVSVCRKIKSRKSSEIKHTGGRNTRICLDIYFDAFNHKINQCRPDINLYRIVYSLTVSFSLGVSIQKFSLNFITSLSHLSLQLLNIRFILFLISCFLLFSSLFSSELSFIIISEFRILVMIRSPTISRTSKKELKHSWIDEFGMSFTSSGTCLNLMNREQGANNKIGATLHVFNTFVCSYFIPFCLCSRTLVCMCIEIDFQWAQCNTEKNNGTKQINEV